MMFDMLEGECSQCHAKVLLNPHFTSVVQYNLYESWLPLQEGLFGLAIGMVKGHGVHYCVPFEVKESGA